jgi:gliding motility-associated lipoprotein GldD
MRKISQIIFLLIVAIAAFSSCKRSTTPKPAGYLRVDYPQKAYQNYTGGAPFTFRCPVYAFLQPDSDRNALPTWYNLRIYKLNATVHLTYKLVNNNLPQLTEEAYTLAYKHAVKADAIREIVINNPKNKVYGLVYEIKGNAASPLQFYLTDSVHNFLRGSLYFMSKPNKDSLAPVIAFVRTDIDTMIQTLNWKSLKK